jgi:hypothetical protein
MHVYCRQTASRLQCRQWQWLDIATTSAVSHGILKQAMGKGGCGGILRSGSVAVLPWCGMWRAVCRRKEIAVIVGE